MLKPAKPTTLMLIDDSPFDRKIIYRVAEHTRLFSTILMFPGGTEALDYIIEHLHHPHKLPDLILLDIQMPEMDGFEFMNKFVKLPPAFRQKCLVAILSSTDDITDIARAESNPDIITLLKKPLHPTTLIKLVEQYYEER